jgi:hypothetical protein
VKHQYIQLVKLIYERRALRFETTSTPEQTNPKNPIILLPENVQSTPKKNPDNPKNPIILLPENVQSTPQEHNPATRKRAEHVKKT